jgi:nucleotide-binding universal stress UspA family protein
MKILIAYDGSDSADAVVARVGKLLAGTEFEATVLTVWEPAAVGIVRAAQFGAPLAGMADDVSDVDEGSERHARKLAEHGAWTARQVGFRATPHWVADDRDVADAILGEASRLDVDLIALGARGLTGIRAFLGSVSNHVLRHSHRPVLVIPPSSASNNGANSEASSSRRSSENGRGR